jgi:hypothetical protein
MDGGEHDLGYLLSKSKEAALQSRATAAEVDHVEFVRVDTGGRYNINRRTQHGDLGTWCLMQSRGCIDDGRVVDGTGWVREKMAAYGAAPDEVAAIEGPFPATRPRDADLDLVLFPKRGGGYAGGLVRFTAHAVVCSAGYWRPNIGRDYPGVLCDRLSAVFGCPILFMQGPCGDHRPRHRDVGTAERDRIGNGLAGELISKLSRARQYPFDQLDNAVESVSCAVTDRLPRTAEETEQNLHEAQERLRALPQGSPLLERKTLAEEAQFLGHALAVLQGKSYLTSEEVQARQAELVVSCIRFGGIRLLTFPGELFSTVTAGLEKDADGPTVVASFADGVTGYLMPQDDLVEGGYEATWALFTPESVSSLRTAAQGLRGA